MHAWIPPPNLDRYCAYPNIILVSSMSKIVVVKVCETLPLSVHPETGVCWHLFWLLSLTTISRLPLILFVGRSSHVVERWQRPLDVAVPPLASQSGAIFRATVPNIRP